MAGFPLPIADVFSNPLSDGAVNHSSMGPAHPRLDRLRLALELWAANPGLL